MLIDPTKAALNSLHELLREEADHFTDASTLFDGRPSADVFRSLATERAEMAGELEEHIRQIGLPKAPDPEKEWVEKIVTRARAAFSANDRTAVVAERQKTEQEIVRRLTAALQENMSPETRRCLEEMLQRLLHTQEQLRDLGA